jgi:RHS repeat-associated protein
MVMNVYPITTPASPSLASPIFDAAVGSIDSLTTSFTAPVVPTLETTTVTEVALGYHRNQQYSITAMTTSTGAVAERYAYTAYGQPTILDASGSVLTNSAIGNRYTYTGREWDETLGLHHFRARWMSPLAGRFLGRDPIGFEGDTLCLYEFFRGWCLDSIDPSGLAFLRPGSTGPNLPGGTGMQQHHLFPKEHGAGINALCRAFGFSIHEFTMLVQGDMTRGSEHWWYQHGCGNYNRKVGEILGGVNNCCDFMRKMVQLIYDTHACVAGNLGLTQIPPIETGPYRGRPQNNWPGGQTLIDLICNSKLHCNRGEKPFPLRETVPNLRLVNVGGEPTLVPLTIEENVDLNDPVINPTGSCPFYAIA